MMADGERGIADESPRRHPLVVDVVTLFPGFFPGPLGTSILERAQAMGAIEVNLVDLRPFGEGPHQQVDDYPFGGGAGMVLMPGPVTRAVEEVRDRRRSEGLGPRVVFMSPQGRTFTQADAVRLAGERSLVLLCGHYKDIDERARRALVDEEVSIGDYVLTGGEPAALVVIDAVARLLPGVLGDEESYRTDSFYQGILDAPYYTRPREFRGEAVPDVLLSGHHEQIRIWRRREALRRTLERRPDLLARHSAGPLDERLLRELGREMDGKRGGSHDGAD